jgi:hypothetical protein
VAATAHQAAAAAGPVSGTHHEDGGEEDDPRPVLQGLLVVAHGGEERAHDARHHDALQAKGSVSISVDVAVLRRKQSTSVSVELVVDFSRGWVLSAAADGARHQDALHDRRVRALHVLHCTRRRQQQLLRPFKLDQQPRLA